MSGKRLIDLKTFAGIMGASEAEARELFIHLSKPTLADVCGERKLADMTEEEFKCLMNLVEVTPQLAEDALNDIEDDENDDCDYAGESMFCEMFCKNYEDYLEAFDADELETVTIELGAVRAENVGYLNPVEVMKWFIEHGFNVLGENVK